VETNVYGNQPLGVGNPQTVPVHDPTVLHTFAEEWYPNQVLSFIDGKLVRTDTQNVPGGPMAFHLNVYVPASS